jgi:hypothetical protein
MGTVVEGWCSQRSREMAVKSGNFVALCQTAGQMITTASVVTSKIILSSQT